MNYIARVIKTRPRLFLSIVFSLAVFALLPESFIQWAVTRSIVAWGAGALMYVGLSFRMMFWSSHQKMRLRAQIEDEGQALILFLVVLAVFASIASVVFELAGVRGLQGWPRYAHMALVGISISIAWVFTHTMFAIHYAHDYYLEISKGRSGGLDFPGDQDPDYVDFLYFSFVVGTSAQTADVSFTSKRMRRTGLVHCTLAFFFNTTLLALAINIGSGLI